MECRGFDRLRVEQLGLNRVENGMTHLVTGDVRTFAGKVHSPLNDVVEEVEAWRVAEPAPGVERVQVDPAIELDGKDFADLPPRAAWNDGRPERRRASEGTCRRVVEKRRRTRMEDRGRRRW